LYGAFEELDEKHYRQQFETNFFGSLAIARMALPLMRSAGRGKIFNVSSILGLITIPTGSAYCASKHAMEAWSEALRYETARLGIAVSLIEPGLIRTSFKANTIYSAAADRSDSPYEFVNRLMKSDYESGFY